MTSFLNVWRFAFQRGRSCIIHHGASWGSIPFSYGKLFHHLIDLEVAITCGSFPLSIVHLESVDQLQQDACKEGISKSSLTTVTHVTPGLFKQMNFHLKFLFLVLNKNIEKKSNGMRGSSPPFEKSLSSFFIV